MLKEAIEKIVSLATPAKFTYGDREYTDKGLQAVREPLAEEVKVGTLAGFVDLVQNGLEKLSDKSTDVLVHVVSHGEVTLISKVADNWGRRQKFATALLPETKGFIFGQFMEHESFVIGLAANFAEAGDREYLLKIASNLTREAVTTSTDDGISQQVGVKVGITLKATEVLRPRVSLAPFRTFREVTQPVSEFVFRVKQAGDTVPSCALFEADGGKWKIDAIEEIARYLRVKLTELPVVS